MKLYTEEQVRQLLNMVIEDMTDYGFSELIDESEVVPIELPSDEEIEQFAFTEYHSVKDSRWFEPLKVGAKWMRDKIQGGNK